MKQITRFVISLIVVGSLSACATDQPRETLDLNAHLLRGVSFDNTARQQATERQLAEAATAVAQSLQTMAAIEKATHPTLPLHVESNPDRIGMGKITSIDWTGPVEPVIRRIAKITQYRVHVLGAKPPIPVIVSINSQNVPVGQILRNIGFQVQKQADIITLPEKHLIEIRYNHL